MGNIIGNMGNTIKWKNASAVNFFGIEVDHQQLCNMHTL